MTGFASTLSATSEASARALSAESVSSSSSKYFPCLTSATFPKPIECSDSAIVRPCGSNTDGFKVTKTLALMHSSGRSDDGPEHPVEDTIYVPQLLVEIECLLDFLGRQRLLKILVGEQQALEILLL